MEKTDRVDNVVNLGDANKMKQLMDDTLVNTLVQEEGFDEDFKLSNLKLAVGLLGCSFALLGQFYPQPFPENRMLLMLCVGVYFACTSILQLIATFVEGDKILVTKPMSGTTFLSVCTILPRYDHNYTIRFTAEESKHEPLEWTVSLGQFFDETGYFVEDKWEAEVKKYARQYRSMLKRE